MWLSQWRWPGADGGGNLYAENVSKGNVRKVTKSAHTGDADDTKVIHKLGLEDIRAGQIILLGGVRYGRAD